MSEKHPMEAPPRELTEDEAQERSEQMYALDQRIRLAMKQGRIALWDAAEALSEFGEQAGWSALGYDHLSDWLADPGIGMSKATFYRLTSTWDELRRRKITGTALEQLDVSKVQIVLPAVKAHKVKLADALDDVKALGQRDLREKYFAGDAPQRDEYGAGGELPDPSPPAEPASGPPVVASSLIDETSSNGDQPDYDDDLDRAMAAALWRVQEEVAPPEKKRMTNSLRDELNAVVKRAIEAGLLDVV